MYAVDKDNFSILDILLISILDIYSRSNSNIKKEFIINK